MKQPPEPEIMLPNDILQRLPHPARFNISESEYRQILFLHFQEGIYDRRNKAVLICFRERIWRAHIYLRPLGVHTNLQRGLGMINERVNQNPCANLEK